VSFEPDGLDASKACHISAKGNVPIGTLQVNRMM
jgi:hypothetical protein